MMIMNQTTILRRGGYLAAALLSTIPRAAIASSDGALRDDGRGTILGLQLQTSVIGVEERSPDAPPNQLFVDEVGGGINLILGYGFTESFALYVSVSSAGHDTSQESVRAFYSTGTLEAAYRFLPGERVRPYLLGGLGGANVRIETDDYDSEISGGVAVLQGGVLIGLSRHLLLDAGIRLDLINWNRARLTRELPSGNTIQLESPVDDSGSAGKLLLGLAWQF
jgi:opacity protein-like surface antigen